MTEESRYSEKLKPSVVRKCSLIGCNKTEVYNGRWKEYWHRYGKIDNNKFLCHKHHTKIVYNPTRTKDQIKRYNKIKTYEYQKKYNESYYDKIITYKHKRILLTFTIHKWKCDWCGKRKGDRYIDSKGNMATIKKIDIHHIEYYIILPWFGTVELCNSCHTSESERLKKIKSQ